jgi:hypothetical protein
MLIWLPERYTLLGAFMAGMMGVAILIGELFLISLASISEISHPGRVLIVGSTAGVISLCTSFGLADKLMYSPLHV